MEYRAHDFAAQNDPLAMSRQDGDVMRKHSVVIAGHRTSVSLEESFWNSLREIAEHRKVSVNRLVETIDTGRATNLSSAIRVFVLRYYREQTGPQRH